ncbi:MAG: TonB-dependent receptor [Bacteroidales bacterium]|jgi:TonB-linked SusC/RagA family outer membrane protein|nr:TonB-dependent receptor [Bacteroidales bacterium]
MLFPALAILCMNGYAQPVRLSLKSNNANLKEVITEIKKQTEFDFLYSKDIESLYSSGDIAVESGSMEEVLNGLFRNSRIRYQIINKTIILTAAEPAAPAAEIPAAAKRQEITVSGTITDAQGNEMPGVNVVVKGALRGVVSDARGKYSVTVPDREAVLVFSFVGYASREIAVGERTVLDVALEEAAQEMEEVVVVGYGVQNRKTLTGSVSVVDMSNVEARSKSTVAQALQGKAAGLRVKQQSAQAGGGASFRIRGEASINAGNDPLIVLDGVPLSANGVINMSHQQSFRDAGATDNLLEAINPEDIESITVLKDAASTAIYGARAGHGVILVTTKRGKNDRLEVTYSGNLTVQTIAKNYEVLNPGQYREILNKYAFEEYLRKYGLDIYRGYVETPAKIPDYKKPFTDEEVAGAVGADWIGEVTQPVAMLHQHNLSVSGGSASGKYLVSGNWMKQDGVVKNNGTERLTVRANLDRELGKYVSAGLTATYSRNKYDNVPIRDGEYNLAGVLQSAAKFNPTLPVRDENGNYTIDPARSISPNPVSLLEITDVTVKDRVIGSAYFAAKPVDGLEVKVQAGADRRFQKRGSYFPKTTKLGMDSNGEAYIGNMDEAIYLADALATYAKTFGNHRLKLLAGYSYQLFEGENANMGNRDFLIDGFLYHNIGAGEFSRPNVSSAAWKSSIASVFGRINYEYMNRYLLEMSFRRDGSSNFTSENRWGFFPSAAAAWIISEEPFMEAARGWLSMLKVRASYGETGNYNVGYHIRDYFGVSSKVYILGGNIVGGVATSEIGNPQLTWETTGEWNLGLNLGFLNNRIMVAAEYFNRQIRDLLDAQPIMSYFEVTSIWANIGKTQSKGFELTVNSVNYDRRHFGWTSALTLSRYEDRWKERSPYWKPKPYEREDDYIRSVWRYRSLGIMQPGEEAPPHQTGLIPGMVRLENRNEGAPVDAEGNDTGRNYTLGEEDMVFRGTTDPQLVFGLNNTLRYRRFDLNVYFYGETGMTREGSYKDAWSQVYGAENVTTFVYETFTHDHTDAPRPSILGKGSSVGDFYIAKGYFVRCGNIRLGYHIPLSRRIAQSCYAYLNTDNPFVITNWTGLDPETDNISFPYPNVRSYSVGLNVTF